MTGLEEFEALFGDVTIATLIEMAVVIAFMVKIYRKVKGYIDERKADWLKEETAKEAKEKAEKERDRKLDAALAAIDKYPEYRAQSIRVQKELEQKIGELKKSQDENTKKLHQMEETQMRESRNRLRDTLLERYRYYTDPSRNPSQSWTSMESEAFWELFGDYERAGGDGYMHTEVQPAMNRLRIEDKEGSRT